MAGFSVIIPNFNGANLLPDCFKSLTAAINQCPDSNFEIILVDNGSIDNSLSVFKKYFSPKIKTAIITLKKNSGFAKAVNLGIKQAIFEYVVICNNDLTVEPSWFSLISQTIKKYPKAACFCGTVLNSTGSLIESQGINFDYAGKCLQINHDLKVGNCPLNTIPVWGSSAALVVYKKDTVLMIGLFKEIYFAYLEDVDLAYRFHRQNQITILNPKAICYHLGGATADRSACFRSYFTFRNWFIFIFYNYSLTQTLKYFPRILIERLRNLSFLLKSYCGKVQSRN